MKLYVSTYAKYNAGSLAGAWIDLDKYPDADAFERACRALHCNERDPEFMFQDCETDPGSDWQEGLYSECSIPRDYWTLKAEFAAHDAKCAKAKDAEQERLCDIYTDMREGKRSGNLKHLKNWNSWRKYYKSEYYFVELSDGFIYAIEKPKIKTRFCCGEDDRGQGGEGYGTMAYAHKYLENKRTERGFKSANLDPFDASIVKRFGRKTWRLVRETKERQLPANYWGGNIFIPAILRGAYKDERPYLGNQNNMMKGEEVVRFLTDDDFRRLRRGHMVVREAFRKRINAYWKRFGASKLHTWTYWTEA